MNNMGPSDDPLYYNGFYTNSVASGWYWACGPERGDIFYNVNSLGSNANSVDAANVDGNNTSLYYNWARGEISYEPNNNTASATWSHSTYETCLTTLAVSQAGKTNYGKHGTTFSWNDRTYDGSGLGTWDAKGYFVEYGNLFVGSDTNNSTAFASASGTLIQPLGEVSLTTISWKSASAYTCDIELPDHTEMVTISVNSGYFTVPSLDDILFLGGTSGTNYINSYNSETQFSSAVFSFNDVSTAEALLSDIVYTLDGMTAQAITATSSRVSPQGNDIYFEGHFYRYVDSGLKSIDWPSAVLAAGSTEDPYFGGRGYIATATTQAENSILLRLVENGAGGSDHWDDAWMGGLWQRNFGTADSSDIGRDVDGKELSYTDLRDSENITELLTDYTITYNDFNGSDQSTFIYANPEIVKYYWIDGPEAGEEILNNTANFAPWHTTNGQQDEPNGGDFIYIGWQGAYWDDLSAYRNDDTSQGYDKLGGYIVEFSGFEGGSTADIIKEATKTVTAIPTYTATVTTLVDGAAANVTENVELKQNGSTAATASNNETGVYTADVQNGTYDVFIGNEDTGVNITISDAAGSATVNYYTVNFSALDAGTASGSSIYATAGGAPIDSGSTILAGKEVVITTAGNGAATYTYAWSGDSTDGQTTAVLSIGSLNNAVNAICTVTGFCSITKEIAANGSFTINANEVEITEAAAGAEVSLTAISASGYRFSSWNVYKTGSPAETIPVSDNSFTMPAYPVTVAVIFRAIPDSGDTLPSRTITVTETSSQLFSDSSGQIKAEANMSNAFSDSVEVKITDTAENASSFSLGAGSEVYPFDISLYVRGSNTKTQPADGYAVTISLPIPNNLLNKKDQLSVVHKATGGTVTTLNSQLTQIDDVWYLVFEAADFSPYALVIGNMRLFGQDRFGTAVSIAGNGWTSADTVIIAPADDTHLVDVLTVAPLAGKTSPILLTKKDGLDRATSDIIKKFGVTKAYVVGAINQPVVEQLNSMGITPIVLKGKDRIETAAAVSAELKNPAGAFVVGYNALADALSIASFAAAHNYAILLAGPDGKLPAAMESFKGHNVNIIGGPALVKDIPGAKRFYGADRYETNKKVLESFTYQYDKVYVANGINNHLVDSLVASSLAAKTESPIVLTSSTRQTALAAVQGKLQAKTVITALGGPSVEN